MGSGVGVLFWPFPQMSRNRWEELTLLFHESNGKALKKHREQKLWQLLLWCLEIPLKTLASITLASKCVSWAQDQSESFWKLNSDWLPTLSWLSTATVGSSPSHWADQRPAGWEKSNSKAVQPALEGRAAGSGHGSRLSERLRCVCQVCPSLANSARDSASQEGCVPQEELPALWGGGRCCLARDQGIAGVWELTSSSWNLCGDLLSGRHVPALAFAGLLPLILSFSTISGLCQGVSL